MAILAMSIATSGRGVLRVSGELSAIHFDFSKLECAEIRNACLCCEQRFIDTETGGSWTE